MQIPIAIRAHRRKSLQSYEQLDNAFLSSF